MARERGENKEREKERSDLADRRPAEHPDNTVATREHQAPLSLKPRGSWGQAAPRCAGTQQTQPHPPNTAGTGGTDRTDIPCGRCTDSKRMSHSLRMWTSPHDGPQLPPSISVHLEQPREKIKGSTWRQGGLQRLPSNLHHKAPGWGQHLRGTHHPGRSPNHGVYGAPNVPRTGPGTAARSSQSCDWSEPGSGWHHLAKTGRAKAVLEQKCLCWVTGAMLRGQAL